jgi:L-alanine-DL-glutamate epimerase-like enolase superfamily enzyme
MSVDSVTGCPEINTVITASCGQIDARSDSLTLGTVPIERIEASCYRVPTDFPESDGTLEWTSTTLVLVRASAGNRTGRGYTYADTGTATLIHDLLSEIVEGRDALAITDNWNAMVSRTRNLGRLGMVSMAISAVDSALWDLKARLLELPLVNLLGTVRESVPIYGSGGFTSYSIDQLQKQLGDWVERGIPRVKMKIGRNARLDLERVRAAHHAIGPEAELFVDANGAYSRKQALAQAENFAELNVNWLEEPVSSNDLVGLRDHVRIEQMFFDGVSPPEDGELRPDLSRPGIGIELKQADVERFAA